MNIEEARTVVKVKRVLCATWFYLEWIFHSRLVFYTRLYCASLERVFFFCFITVHPMFEARKKEIVINENWK